MKNKHFKNLKESKGFNDLVTTDDFQAYLDIEFGKINTDYYLENYSSDYNWEVVVEPKHAKRSEVILQKVADKYPEFGWRFEKALDDDRRVYFMYNEGAPSGEDMEYLMDDAMREFGFGKYAKKEASELDNDIDVDIALDNLLFELEEYWPILEEDIVMNDALLKIFRDATRKYLKDEYTTDEMFELLDMDKDVLHDVAEEVYEAGLDALIESGSQFDDDELDEASHGLVGNADGIITLYGMDLVIMGYYEGSDEYIKEMKQVFPNITFELKNESGPGGGWPVFDITGNKQDLLCWLSENYIGATDHGEEPDIEKLRAQLSDMNDDLNELLGLEPINLELS